MFTLPQSYEIVANSKVESEASTLIHDLQQLNFTEAKTHINAFSIKHNAYIELTTKDETIIYGQDPKSSATVTIVANIKFTDIATESFLTILANTSAHTEITSAFLTLLPFIVLAIIIISCLGAFFCSRVLVKPIIEISSISKRMSELDMTWRCNINRTDELGLLASSLNSMADRLNIFTYELETTNKKLSADIISAKQMEKQRKDFFAAVSHELKTPLTMIKAQIESMILGIGDYKNHQKYLPEVLLAVDSMEVLVQEILTIAKMEALGLAEQMESIDLTEMIIECINILQPLADEKQIVIKPRLQENQCIFVERSLFKKAVSNALLNAIQHTPVGQHIFVTLNQQQLLIENTGVTIKADDLLCLFTPFYRVEKSRNRTTGGSGLGLYIIKTILELHNLTCNISNQENSVLFTINLNQN